MKKSFEISEDTFQKLVLIADHFSKRGNFESDNDRAEGAINNMMGFVSVYSDELRKIVYDVPEVEFILDGGEIREV
jgi:hypothetical protein